MTDPIVYICGPAFEVPNYWEAFEKAEDQLRDRGFVPLNPSVLPGGLNRKVYYATALNMLLRADAVYVLPICNNKDAKGCKIERQLAEHLGIPVYENISDLLREVPRCI